MPRNTKYTHLNPQPLQISKRDIINASSKLQTSPQCFATSTYHKSHFRTLHSQNTREHAAIQNKLKIVENLNSSLKHYKCRGHISGSQSSNLNFLYSYGNASSCCFDYKRHTATNHSLFRFDFLYFKQCLHLCQQSVLQFSSNMLQKNKLELQSTAVLIIMHMNSCFLNVLHTHTHKKKMTSEDVVAIYLANLCFLSEVCNSYKQTCLQLCTCICYASPNILHAKFQKNGRFVQHKLKAAALYPKVTTPNLPVAQLYNSLLFPLKPGEQFRFLTSYNGQRYLTTIGTLSQQLVSQYHFVESFNFQCLSTNISAMLKSYHPAAPHCSAIALSGNRNYGKTVITSVNFVMSMCKKKTRKDNLAFGSHGNLNCIAIVI